MGTSLTISPPARRERIKGRAKILPPPLSSPTVLSHCGGGSYFVHFIQSAKIYKNPAYLYIILKNMGNVRVKEELRRKYEELNPAELRRRILRFQRRLFRLATPVKGVVYE